MTCKYTTKDIGYYLLNKMTPEEETEFQFHLSQCEKCRTGLQAIRDLAEGLKEDNDEQPVLSGEKLLPRKKYIYLRRSLSAACVVLLCGLGIVFYNQPDKPVTKKALIPESYLHQDSISHPRDSIIPTTKRDSL